MTEETTSVQGLMTAADESSPVEETPFDRLEAKIDALIERYEQLRTEHQGCCEQLAEREARIRELEEQVQRLEELRTQARSRLDTLIGKLNHYS